MINYDPNMSRKQVMEELPLPDKVQYDSSVANVLGLIYKAVFIAIKLLLDIRLNLVKISEGKKIQTNYKEKKEKSNEKS